MAHVDVLVVGAGPVGLTAASELVRRGVDCRVIDTLAEPMPYAKAVGIQPRTLEVWDSMGLVRQALDAAEPMLGQLVYINGRQMSSVTLDLPPDVPYGFAALPQYEVEHLLADHLAARGTHVERGTRLESFEHDGGEVRATLAHASGSPDEEVTAGYLIGCDGAHSTVRRGLGLSFEGGAFPEEYMIGDVQVDWSLPRGYVIRSMHQTDGTTDDQLVCVPLPGPGRYRMSMNVPPELSRAPDHDGGDRVLHGIEPDRAPGLEQIQAVLDRLAPQAVTATHLRWSSVFRISHRLVDHYADGRVFVAGDAAHIHPPTGAQGMNTGIQDAYNLAWKLALAVHGAAADGLLDSYEAERLPVAEEVVGRTVRHARSGIEGDPDEPSTVVKREAQLLVGYPDSPIVGPADSRPAGSAPPIPVPGERAPDCAGLHAAIATYPLRLFDLLRDHDHILLLYADGAAAAEQVFPRLADLALRRSDGHLAVYAVLAPGVLPGDGALLPPIVHDSAGEFRAAYGPRATEAFLIRPDGYLGLRADPADGAALLDHLGRTFAAA